MSEMKLRFVAGLKWLLAAVSAGLTSVFVLALEAQR